MQSRWFWENWVKEYRWMWYGISSLLLVSIICLWVYYFIGIDVAFHWEKLHDQKTIEIISHTFQSGGFEFSIPIESYITYEFFNGSSYHLNEFIAYAYVFILVAAATLLLTVITTFSRFWYLIGAGLFILFIVSLRLEVLRVGSSTNQWLTVATIIVYIIPSFYFNSFNRSASFMARFALLSAVTILLGLFINFFSTVKFPFLHLWVTGFTPGLVITVVFILLIGHEIIASFIYLVSQGTSSSKSLRHFLIISVVYLTNLVLLYMHEARIIDWNFLYINVYLLFTVSGLLAIFSYKNREPLYENIMTFAPFGALFFTAIATIAFITTASFLGTANDAALKVIRDFIIFSHIGLGGIFVVYIISNFILMLAENFNVYKVLYKPNRMPFITFRIAGLITVLGFIFYNNWHGYVYNSLSGFYNNLGDLYVKLEKNGLAEAYYEQARTYGFQNNHSNYIIADHRARSGDFDKAHNHYELANDIRPTPYSLANEGNLYMMRGNVFPAIKIYKEGIKRIPQSGVLENNLGYALAKVHALDSALEMVEKAREHTLSKNSAEINFAAFAAQEYLPLQADSLLTIFEPTPLLRSNLLTIASLHHQKFKAEFNPLENPILDLFTATQLNNFIVKNLKSLDSTFLNKAFKIASDSLNIRFREALKLSLAHAFYHNNNVTKAFELMGELAYTSQLQQGQYNYIAGLWALEQGASELATSYFSYAELQDYKQARVYNAIALADSKNSSLALSAALLLQESSNENDKLIGKKLQKTLTASVTDLATDEDRYLFFRYRLKANDTLAFNALITKIENADVKAQTLLEMSERQFNYGNTVRAIQYFNRITGLQLTDKKLYSKIQHFELLMLASRGELRTLAKLINEGITFSHNQELEKLLYTALLNEASYDTINATRNFELLGKSNPFFEEGVIAASRYFKTHSTEDLKAYNILTEAIHINKNSIRLHQAYVAEAARLGFDEFALDAQSRLNELRNSR